MQDDNKPWDDAADKAKEVGEQAGQAVGDAAQAAKQWGDDAVDATKEAAEKASEVAGDVVEKTGEAVEAARVSAGVRDFYGCVGAGSDGPNAGEARPFQLVRRWKHHVLREGAENIRV